MARALIVGCGCRGTGLGRRLLADGWQVRGTSRTEAGLERIGSTGIEPALADPDRVGTLLEHVDDVAVVIWALGSASGESAADVNGHRLERVLERLVDTPVRGFVFEAAGSAQAETLAAGAELVNEAERVWRLPARIVATAGEDYEQWEGEMVAAATGLIGA